MATRIRASCGECGDVELRVEDIDVRICADDHSGTYVFRCPTCRMAVVKDAEERVIDLLAASGVRMTHWNLPAEIFETHRGPAFTHDDLLDFHHLLQSDDWLEQLRQSDGDNAVDSIGD